MNKWFYWFAIPFLANFIGVVVTKHTFFELDEEQRVAEPSSHSQIRQVGHLNEQHITTQSGATTSSSFKYINLSTRKRIGTSDPMLTKYKTIPELNRQVEDHIYGGENLVLTGKRPSDQKGTDSRQTYQGWFQNMTLTVLN